ncbi:MAG: hypothetical protein HC888_18425 [Candidatus Competibacteraceae bacterium]|nr:hypothetical protein [Candidatus Competibacteraceae bacterium]
MDACVRQLAVIVFVAVCSLIANTAQAQGTLEDILAQTRRHVTNVGSLSYTSGTQRLGPDGSLLSSTDHDFKYDSGRYYSSARSTTKDGEFDRTFAYNGEVFQELDPQQASLYLRRKIEKGRVRYPTPEPLTLAYLFAIEPLPGNEISLDLLKQDRTWARLGEIGRHVGQDTVRDQPCEVAEFTLAAPNGNTVVYKVAFARNLGMFPIKLEAKLNGEALTAVQEVEDVLVDDASNPPLVLPLAISTHGYNPDGSLHHTTKVGMRRETIEINKGIPEEVFTIPRSQLRVGLRLRPQHGYEQGRKPARGVGRFAKHSNRHL